MASNASKQAYPLKLGIGIHMAHVQAGYLRSGTKIEFNVFGDLVVLGQPLESAAGKDSDEILVSYPVSKTIKNEFELGAEGTYATKEEFVFGFPVLGIRVM